MRNAQKACFEGLNFDGISNLLSIDSWKRGVQICPRLCEFACTHRNLTLTYFFWEETNLKCVRFYHLSLTCCGYFGWLFRCLALVLTCADLMSIYSIASDFFALVDLICHWYFLLMRVCCSPIPAGNQMFSIVLVTWAAEAPTPPALVSFYVRIFEKYAVCSEIRLFHLRKRIFD